MTEQELRDQRDVILQIVQKEIDKNNAIEAFRRAVHVIRKVVRCPVCGKVGYFNVQEGLGKWFAKCNNCNFDPGTAKTIEELLMRILTFSENEYRFWGKDEKTKADEDEDEDEDEEPYEYE